MCACQSVLSESVGVLEGAHCECLASASDGRAREPSPTTGPALGEKRSAHSRWPGQDLQSDDCTARDHPGCPHSHRAKRPHRPPPPPRRRRPRRPTPTGLASSPRRRARQTARTSRAGLHSTYGSTVRPIHSRSLSRLSQLTRRVRSSSRRNRPRLLRSDSLHPTLPRPATPPQPLARVPSRRGQTPRRTASEEAAREGAEEGRVEGELGGRQCVRARRGRAGRGTAASLRPTARPSSSRDCDCTNSTVPPNSLLPLLILLQAPPTARSSSHPLFHSRSSSPAPTALLPRRRRCRPSARLESEPRALTEHDRASDRAREELARFRRKRKRERDGPTSFFGRGRSEPRGRSESGSPRVCRYRLRPVSSRRRRSTKTR